MDGATATVARVDRGRAAWRVAPAGRRGPDGHRPDAVPKAQSKPVGHTPLLTELMLKSGTRSGGIAALVIDAAHLKAQKPAQ